MIEEWVYFDSNNREMKLSELNNVHLLNAFLKIRDQLYELGQEATEWMDVLKKEIMRRMDDKENELSE